MTTLLPWFAHPAWLALLPLALLPWWRRRGTVLRYPVLALLPADPLAAAASIAGRLAASLAMAGTVLGLAGLQRPEAQVERLGQGAEIVLLLDRSRSMDQPFLRRDQQSWTDTRAETKGQVARRLLAEFSARRPEDTFGMVLFSTAPIPALPFTQRQEPIQAAIAAGALGRGLAETDIGRAMLEAIAYFGERPYSGSRIILLVSDGGAQIDIPTRRRIVEGMRRERIALYWIYIRAFRARSLAADPADDAEASTPEQFLHRYFQALGTPYRAYEADNPDALRRAIEDVSRLQSLPIHYREQVPAEDLTRGCYGAAGLAVALLLALHLLRLRRWT